MNSRLMLIVSLFLVASPPVILAENASEQPSLFSMSLEELLNVRITSASFFELSGAQTVGYAAIYNMDDIAVSPARSVADIIDLFAPGIFVGTHERNGPLVGQRGVLIDRNSKTMVMLDGQLLNQRQAVGVGYPLASPLIGDIRQLEVINGPSAVVHGSGAINGFINMIPRNGADDAGLRTRAEYGFEDDLRLADIAYGKDYGDGRDVFIYFGVYGAQGFEADDIWDSGLDPAVFEHPYVYGTRDENYKLSMNWRNQDFSVIAALTEMNPTHARVYSTGATERHYYHHQSLTVRPKYRWQLSSVDAVEFAFANEITDYGRITSPVEADTEASSERHHELKTTYTTERSIHKFAMGLLYGVRDFAQGEYYFDSDPGGSYESVNGSWKESALFGEDIMSLTDKLTLSLGLRYDYVDYDQLSNDNPQSPFFTPNPQAAYDSKGEPSGRLALAYATDPSTYYKLSYQRGFRYPDATAFGFHNYNQYLISDVLGLDFQLPVIKPECMDSIEANFHKTLTPRKLCLDLNLYYNRYRDQLGFRIYSEGESDLPAGLVTQVEAVDPRGRMRGMANANEVFDSAGGELVLSWRAIANTLVDVSYGYNELIDSPNDRYPRHLLKLHVSRTFLNNRIIIDGSYRYNSADYEQGSIEIHPAFEESRERLDLAISYNHSENVSLRLKGLNVLEEDVPDMTFNLDQPWIGGNGTEQRRVYLLAEIRL